MKLSVHDLNVLIIYLDTVVLRMSFRVIKMSFKLKIQKCIVNCSNVLQSTKSVSLHMSTILYA